jgi:hypothetical protein
MSFSVECFAFQDSYRAFQRPRVPCDIHSEEAVSDISVKSDLPWSELVS